MSVILQAYIHAVGLYLEPGLRLDDFFVGRLFYLFPGINKFLDYCGCTFAEIDRRREELRAYRRQKRPALKYIGALRA